MSHFPDFSNYGYRVVKELGANRSGGRVTYLATKLSTRTQIVIKEFQFARTSSTWDGYSAYEREIEVLQGMNHPGIPQYLNSFQTKNGFCMVQEYKEAEPLSTRRTFNLEEIRKVAIATLEILIYLQNRVPAVIHRDLKPDNILIDEQLNVYLVDFGFARVGEGEIGVSSVVKGTLGFMPPEQIFNRLLTEASDLYGLGMTLICLLTGTKSTDVGSLVDVTYKVNFKQVLPKVSTHWVHWLERMVEPRLKNRFPNACTALEALPQETLYAPEVKFSQTELLFATTQIRQRLTQTITLRNSVPNTLLQGEWKVAPHPSDPSTADPFHAWISVEPTYFTTNLAECQITVDTQKLASGKLFCRKLQLHTNSAIQIYTVDIQVKTASAVLKFKRFPYVFISLLFSFLVMIGYVLAHLLIGFSAQSFLGVNFGAIAGAAIGLIIAAGIAEAIGVSSGMKPSVITGVILGGIALFMSSTGQISNSLTDAVAGAIVGLISGIMVSGATSVTIEALTYRNVNPTFATTLSFLIMVAAVSVGIGIPMGMFNPWILLPLVCSSIPLAILLSYSLLQRIRVTNDHRETQRHLIKS